MRGFKRLAISLQNQILKSFADRLTPICVRSILTKEDYMQTITYLILVPMVYLAFLVFVVGTVIQMVRIRRAPKNPATLQIFPEKKPKWLWALHDSFLMPTVRRHYPVRWVILMSFHIALLLLIIGHLELFKGFTFFQFWEHEIFLGKGFVGLALSLALLYSALPAISLPGPGAFRPRRLLPDHPAFSDRALRRRTGLGQALVRLWGIVSGRLSNLSDRPFVFPARTAGGCLSDRPFLYAGLARLLCQSLYHAFPLQQGHAFHFQHFHE